MSTNLTENTNVLLFSHRTMLMIARIAREQFQGVVRESFVFFVMFVDQTLLAYQLHGVLVCPSATSVRARPERPRPMKTYPNKPAPPVRRDLNDGRSSKTSAPVSRKTLLNDRRSTR